MIPKDGVAPSFHNMRVFTTRHLDPTLPPFAQFRVRNNMLHPITRQGAAGSSLPWYKIEAGKLYPTRHNPEGHSALPWYEIRGSDIHRTIHHPSGHSMLPAYRIRK